MALNVLQSVIGRAVMDMNFRQQLKTNPDPILNERDLTPEEKEALKSMDWDSVESLGRNVEHRVSRMALDAGTCNCPGS